MIADTAIPDEVTHYLDSHHRSGAPLGKEKVASTFVSEKIEIVESNYQTNNEVLAMSY